MQILAEMQWLHILLWMQVLERMQEPDIGQEAVGTEPGQDAAVDAGDRVCVDAGVDAEVNAGIAMDAMDADAGVAQKQSKPHPAVEISAKNG